MLAIQALRGIEFLHNKNMLHRDIKPNNTLLSVGGSGPHTMFLVDFGEGRHPPHCKCTYSESNYQAIIRPQGTRIDCGP